MALVPPIQGDSYPIEEQPRADVALEVLPGDLLQTPEVAVGDGRVRKIGRNILNACGYAYDTSREFMHDLMVEPKKSAYRFLSAVSLAQEAGSGVVRYVVASTIFKETGSIPKSIGYLAGSTLLGEMAASAAMSSVLDRGESKIIEKVNEGLDHIIDPRVEVSPLAKAVVTNYTGVPGLLAALRRNDETRSGRADARTSALAIPLLTGAVAVQGTLLELGIVNIDNPRVAGTAAAAVGTIVLASKKAKNHLESRRRADRFKNFGHGELLEVVEPTKPEYEMPADELAILEHEMVDKVKDITGEGVVCAWVDPRHPFSNISRTNEETYFSEVEEIDTEVDFKQRIAMLVDTREGEGRVVHAATITDYDPKKLRSRKGRTGFYTIDSLIERGNFSAKDFVEYYKKLGIKLEECVSVETNFRIGKKMSRFEGLRSADLMYVTLYNMIIESGAEIGKSIVFATINNLQKESLRRLGLNVEPLMNRTDYVTEEAEHDVHSEPVAIMIDEQCRDILGGLGLRLPDLYIGIKEK